MQGRPVWLASVSKRDLKRQVIIPNTRWPKWMKDVAKQTLWQALKDVGDKEKGWRMFRMNITYCLHVAVSDHELELLPGVWQDQPGGALAGGPVAVLDAGNCGTAPSVLPCENPGHEALPMAPGNRYPDPDMWFPRDCGLCEPCLDRIRIEEMIGGQTETADQAV